MTDEELAEEWVDKEISLGTSMYNPQIEHYCKQAFLAGLKAGRPQWHRPSEKLPKTTVLNEDGIKVYYDYDIKCWRYDDADEYLCDTPIAWCEIPTFDKE